MKVVVCYRVAQHYRVPIFRRLAGLPQIDLCLLHGEDFPGTHQRNADDLSGFRSRRLETLRLAYRGSARAVEMPFWPGLLPALVRERPDVILAEGGSNLLNNVLVFAYAGLTRTPVVWWTLGAHRYDSLTRLQRIFRAAVRFFERRADALLGYSSVAKAYFEANGYPEEKQFIAYNSLDTDFIEQCIRDAQPRVAELRAEHELDGKRVVFFAGELTPFKRLEDALVAYAKLRREPDGAFDDLRFVIMGDGVHRPALQRFVEAEGIPDVFFTGRIGSLEGAAWFQLANLLVLPGLGGLSISEALIHGVPVVACRADGTEVDLVQNGQNGFLAPVGDPDALADAMRDVLSDPDEHRRMAAHSRHLVDTRFNIRTMVDGILAALEYAGSHRARAR